MKAKNALILFLCALIWGTTFVAQSAAMEHIGPFTFLCLRSILGGLFLLPICAVTGRNGSPRTATSADRRQLVIAGLCCGIVLFLASGLQQVAMALGISAGKTGFLTACYILLVPIIGLLRGRKCGLNVWCGVLIAVVGLYLLCIRADFTIEPGDLLGLACAVMFALHITVIDHFVIRVDSVRMSCLQFWFIVPLAAVCMVLFETPSAASIWAAMGDIAYAGIFSSGIAYTLQIVGQKGMSPTISSLIMSLEAVVSVVAGWLILGEQLSSRELLGCVLMFAAILLAQLPPRKTAPAS